MTELRLLGLMAGVAVLAYFFFQFRKNRISRLDFTLALGLVTVLVGVSLFPGAVTVLRDMLALEDTQFSRLIAISIISNALLWFFWLHLRMKQGLERRYFDRLVCHLAVESFQTQYTEPLAPITVAIPAFNEAENIGAVLSQLPTEIQGRRVGAVVIDDGSEDGTADIVAAMGVPVVKSPLHRGGGAALRIGFEIARAGGAEIAVTMDADGQHLGAEVERLVEPILENKWDVVIGSRILGKREKDHVARLVGIHVFNTIIRILTPVRITDCANGFRAFRCEVLGKLNLHQDQYHTSEFIIEAAKKGIPMGEAPVTVKRRQSGESKKGNHWKYGFNFAWAILKTWWRKP